MKNILSCMAVTVAMLPSLLRAETVIEVNLDNIKQYEVVQIIRFEGGGGKSVHNDTIRDGKSSFTFTCGPITEDVYYYVVLKKGKSSFSNHRTIYVSPDSEATLSGSGDYPPNWEVKSPHPLQAHENWMNDVEKEFLNAMQDIDYVRDTTKNKEQRQALYDKRDSIDIQMTEKLLLTLQEMPIDSLWLEDFARNTTMINYEGTDYPHYGLMKDVYGRLSEADKATPIGKRITNDLFGKKLKEGDKFVDYDLYDIDEKVHHLADYQGKWMLVDFSSYHCGPCRLITPMWKYLYEKGGNEKLEIITILDDAKKQFEALVKSDKPVSPLFYDHDGKNGIHSLYKISGTPTFFVINPEGKIVRSWLGTYTEKVMQVVKEAGAYPAPTYKTENGVTTIVNPTYTDFSTILVDKVEIYKDSVILDCTQPQSRSFRISSRSGLYVNGQCVSKITSCSFGLDKNAKAKFGESCHFRLTFEPLPAGTTAFDFKEGDKKGDFFFLGMKVKE